MSLPRVMLYVQHLLGTGHQYRMAAISRALSRAGLEVCFVSGGMPIPKLETGAQHVLQLPPARVADTRYDGLLDSEGIPVDDDWRQRRADLLLEHFASFRPDCLVVESFPFGRRLLRFELIPMLEAAKRRAKPPTVFCSIRDILEPKSKPERNAETVGHLQEYFDGVLVHGDPRFVRLEASFPLAEQVRDLLHYTGYVYRDTRVRNRTDVGSGEVVVSAGGGVVAERLMHAVFSARSKSSLSRCPWRCLLGSNTPKQVVVELERSAPRGVIVERNRADFQTLLANCMVSISQAGYNTVIEVLVSGAAAVLAPFGDGHEREQILRTQTVCERTPVEVVLPTELTGSRLALAVDKAAKVGRRVTPVIDVGGAAESVRILLAAMTTDGA